MSTGLQQKPQNGPALGVGDVSRIPQQGRSKASLERMLLSARELLIERGDEDFTLQEVSSRGNVSIGSIYLRFESKENLVRAVIGQFIDEIGTAETAMLEAVCQSSQTLGQFMPNYVEAYAEFLRQNAPLLRLSMMRAEFDPLVSGPGKARALAAARAGTDAMLGFRHEFGGSDHEVRAGSAFHVIFATLARQLSLGSTRESVHDTDWLLLKRELARMCLAYLRSPD